MTALALIFILSIIGIGETTYIIRERMIYEKPMCPIGGKCQAVLTSKYNKIFSIPNDILGLITYITIFLLAISIALGFGSLNIFTLLLKIVVFVAAIFSIILTYIEWKVIKSWCFWCLLSAITLWLMSMILILV